MSGRTAGSDQVASDQVVWCRVELGRIVPGRVGSDRVVSGGIGSVFGHTHDVVPSPVTSVTSFTSVTRLSHLCAYGGGVASLGGTFSAAPRRAPSVAGQARSPFLSRDITSVASFIISDIRKIHSWAGQSLRADGGVRLTHHGGPLPGRSRGAPLTTHGTR